MRRRLLLGTILVIGAPFALNAQGILAVQENKCALDKQGQIHRMIDSLFIPIAQELVNEGKLIAVGSDYHAWGDEWNVVAWYQAQDLPTFLAAFRELTKRTNERHPDFLPQIFSWCSEHKDSFYTVGRMTTPAPAAPPSTPAKKN